MIYERKTRRNPLSEDPEEAAHAIAKLVAEYGVCDSGNIAISLKSTRLGAAIRLNHAWKRDLIARTDSGKCDAAGRRIIAYYLPSTDPKAVAEFIAARRGRNLSEKPLSHGEKMLRAADKKRAASKPKAQAASLWNSWPAAAPTSNLS